MMGEGTYVNALEAPDPGQVRATYGPKYDRLAWVKAAYDPADVFHRNVNIATPVIPSPRGG
jgi:Berberine and berberine like